jgi:hypothetical protein
MTNRRLRKMVGDFSLFNQDARSIRTYGIEATFTVGKTSEPSSAIECIYGVPWERVENNRKSLADREY